MHRNKFIHYLLLVVNSIMFREIVATPLPIGHHSQTNQLPLSLEDQTSLNRNGLCGVPGLWVYPCDWNAEKPGMHRSIFSVFIWCKWIVSTPRNLAGTLHVLDDQNSRIATKSAGALSPTTPRDLNSRDSVNAKKEVPSDMEAGLPTRVRRALDDEIPSRTASIAPRRTQCKYKQWGWNTCTPVPDAASPSFFPPRIFTFPTLIIHFLSSIPRAVASTMTNMENIKIANADKSQNHITKRRYSTFKNETNCTPQRPSKAWALSPSRIFTLPTAMMMDFLSSIPRAAPATMNTSPNVTITTKMTVTTTKDLQRGATERKGGKPVQGSSACGDFSEKFGGRFHSIGAAFWVPQALEVDKTGIATMVVLGLAGVFAFIM